MKILLDLFRNYNHFYTQPPFLETEKSLDLSVYLKSTLVAYRSITTDLTAGHTQQTCPLPDAALKG